MKNLFFFFAFLFVNSIYSSNTCSPGTDFTYTFDSTTCVYTFTPSFGSGGPINHLLWRWGSAGTYARQCDTTRIDSPATWTNSQNHTFCFYGNQAVGLVIYYSNGSVCSVDSIINIRCVGSLECNPDPGTASIPDPVVEITYKEPYLCATNQGSSVSGCMYNVVNGRYNISCGWTWALRIPASAYNCTIFTYYVEYTAATTCGSYPCARLVLDTTVKCITAQIGQPIYIVATENNCCVPSGYQRGFIWTPTITGSATPIRDPDSGIYGHCTAYRSCPGHSGNCTEDQQTLNQTSGWPSPPNCFTGGPTIEARDYINLEENANIEQNVIIYNIQGIEIFNGKWKFGEPGNLYLNWPGGIGSGLYIVKFQNSKENRLTKLYKIN